MIKINNTEIKATVEDKTVKPKKENSVDSIKKSVEIKDKINVSIDVENAIQAKSLNPTTKAILNLKTNPFYHDKRKWDDSFTIAEKNELEGNIVKAAKDNDGETYVTLKQEEFIVPEEESQESDDLDSVNGKKPGRKPLPDEEGLSDPDQDPKIKRKAQNRVAQRAFRERKEKYVKDLEIKFKQAQDNHTLIMNQLIRENQHLRSIIIQLEIENAAFKGVHYTPSIPPTPLRLPPTTPKSSSSNTPVAILPAIKKKSPKSPPLEYTFAISTPDSLRKPIHPLPDTPQPIELVQLYPPQQQPPILLSQPGLLPDSVSHPPVTPSQSNLSQSNLSQSNLSQSNLSQSNLSQSNLSQSNLSQSNLSQSNLSQSNLSQSNLSQPNLSQSNLSQSNLSQSNLSQSNLSQPNHPQPSLPEPILSQPTPESNPSTPLTQPDKDEKPGQFKHMRQLELDLSDCHLDSKDSLLFQQEINQLLSDPLLYDPMTNLSIDDYLSVHYPSKE